MEKSDLYNLNDSSSYRYKTNYKTKYFTINNNNTNQPKNISNPYS